MGLYIWVKYADDSNGNGMSNNSDGKRFIGIAKNRRTAIESNIPCDYEWAEL